MTSLLLHQQLWRRFLALFCLVIIVFGVAWLLSYYLLPEGVLRGKMGGQILAGADAANTMAAEWARIFSINIAICAFFMILPNLIKVENGIPLGYYTVLIQSIIYAITLGTNSFTFPLPGGKMFPTLEVLTRSGPYEIAAYTLAVTATYAIARYQLKGRWPAQTAARIDRTGEPLLSHEQWVGVVAAAFLLLVANGWEAFTIVSNFS